MAIVFNQAAPLISPVYGPITFDVYDSSYSSYPSVPAYFMVRIEYESGLDSNNEVIWIKQKPAPYLNNCKFNISSILQGLVNNKVHTHYERCQHYYNPGYTGIPDPTTLDKPILNYGLTFYSLDASNNTLNTSLKYDMASGTDKLFALYGTNDTPGGVWDTSAYIFKGDVSANFLTTWESPREVHNNDEAFMQFISYYDTADPSYLSVWHLNKLRVSKYTSETATPDVSLFDVSTRTQFEGNNYYGRAYVCSINVGPRELNVDGDKYKFYTVADSSGWSKTYRFNFVEEDTRFDKYYRIYWVNKLGGTEAFNFDLATQNNINISKQIFSNNNMSTVYGVNVEDVYTLTSNWMCDTMSQELKDLWYSPKVYLQECYYDSNDVFDPSTLVPVIISETSKQIMNRRNSQLINYTLTFVPANEFYTIKQ